MTIELITGHAGSAHISAADDGWLNVGIVGGGKYVLGTGTQFACNVQSANLVTIGIGDAIFEGRHVRVSTTENVALDNGAQGVNRNDLICIKYNYDSGTGVESASLEVLKGTATSGTAIDPTIPSGSILDGATTAYMPLWRIPISGITVGTPVKLYGEVLNTLDLINTGPIAASRITGKVAAANIGDLGDTYLKRKPSDSGELPAAPASQDIYPIALSDSFADGGVVSYMTAANFRSSIGIGSIGVKNSISTSDITSGTLPVTRGGTGKTSGTAWMADTIYSSAGVNTNITLTASAANYTMMEIFFRDQNSHYASTKVYGPNGKTVCLSMATNNVNGQNNYKRREVSISGTAINTQSYGEQDGGASAVATNNIFIYAVVGYK